MIFKNSVLSIDNYDKNTISVVVTNCRLGNKLNKTLGTYGKYLIKDGEEPLFLISHNKIDLFLSQIPRGMDKATLRKIIKNGVNNVD